ncbi:MAG: short-chain dehydrogenase/reductase [Ilumatobacteraceae bacterium]|nr:short-chain dehydrogenase/reductase [Ilumatobacteraceae bacterium]MCU1387016.1 short-chain dehydrogenase/reductase [Ilumatobacteraceae bacterium]
MSRLEGKVAFITGAARGQGRSHAVRLASEGAHVVISDICGPVDHNMIKPSSSEDLDKTLQAIADAAPGSKVISRQVDVRDADALIQLADDAVAELGGIDIVVANAGILNWAEVSDYTTEMFTAVIDVNLTGVFNTVRATVPHMIEAGRGGSVILISSAAGIKGQPFTLGYTAAKHGVVGICRGLANELGEHRIRVNSIHPSGVETAMGDAQGLMEIIMKHAETMGPLFMNSLPTLMADPSDISNAVAFLASDEAAMITGLQMKIDMGTTNR